LGVSDNINAQNWVITTVAAACSLIYNVVYWPWDHQIQITPMESIEKSKMQESIELQSVPSIETPTKDTYSSIPMSPIDNASSLDLEVNTALELNSPSQERTLSFADDVPKLRQAKQLEDATFKKFTETAHDPDEIRVEDPTVKASIVNCPWAVLPFVFGMFTLVNALKDAGWIDALANGILDVIPSDQGNSGTAIATSAFLMTAISCLLCTLIDNQPASILLTQVLLAPAFDSLPSLVRTAGMLGVLEGANVGGCWSLMGALAGIMWSTLLRNKGIQIGYIQFMRVSWKVMPIVTFMVALIIFAESYTKA